MDSVIVKKVKTEGGLIGLPSDKLSGLIAACDIIAKYDLLSYVNNIFTKGVLSPLTLKDDEFSEDLTVEHKGDYINIRYPSIVKTKFGMLNEEAYYVYIRAKYNHNTKQQEKFEPQFKKFPVRLYISKGGVVTGEYIQNCIIKDEDINKHSYTIQNIPSIPVAMVTRKDETYFVVDHREPKIKLLKEHYNVPVYIDEKVQKLKFNLRIYKKLDK